MSFTSLVFRSESIGVRREEEEGDLRNSNSKGQPQDIWCPGKDRIENNMFGFKWSVFVPLKDQLLGPPPGDFFFILFFFNTLF